MAWKREPAKKRCKELIHLSRLEAEALGYYTGDLCFQRDWNKGFGTRKCGDCDAG